MTQVTLIWQGLDPAVFILDFAARIYHVHVKDAKLNLNGRNGILGIPYHIWRSGEEDGTLYRRDMETLILITSSVHSIRLVMMAHFLLNGKTVVCRETLEEKKPVNLRRKLISCRPM